MAEVKVKQEMDLCDPAEVEYSQMRGSDHQDTGEVNHLQLEVHKNVASSLKQEIKECSHIKVEQELCIKQEEEQLHEFPVILVTVKSEDEETNEEEYAESKPACSIDSQRLLRSGTAEQFEESSDTDNSEDWTESMKPPAEAENDVKRGTQEHKGHIEDLQEDVFDPPGEKPFCCSVCVPPPPETSGACGPGITCCLQPEKC